MCDAAVDAIKSGQSVLSELLWTSESTKVKFCLNASMFIQKVSVSDDTSHSECYIRTAEILEYPLLFILIPVGQ